MKYLSGLIGLALLGGSLLPGQASAAVANDAAAIGRPSQADQATCGGGAACNACGKCCPHCGCRLAPVCHTYCTTKKVTEYKYSCISEDMCIPGVTPLCKKLATCETWNEDCQKGCEGRCTVREVNKLVKRPVTKEVPVRTCTVEWVCPNRCDDDSGESTSVPTAASVAPSPVPQQAPSPKVLPPRPKTTDAAPLPSEIGSVRVR